MAENSSNIFVNFRHNMNNISKDIEEIFNIIDKNLHFNNDFNNDIDTDTDKILELFSKSENQIYMLDLGIKRYVSPSLLICLNYIYENQINENYWDIYNLRNV